MSGVNVLSEAATNNTKSSTSSVLKHSVSQVAAASSKNLNNLPAKTAKQISESNSKVTESTNKINAPESYQKGKDLQLNTPLSLLTKLQALEHPTEADKSSNLVEEFEQASKEVNRKTHKEQFTVNNEDLQSKEKSKIGGKTNTNTYDPYSQGPTFNSIVKSQSYYRHFFSKKGSTVNQRLKRRQTEIQTPIQDTTTISQGNFTDKKHDSVELIQTNLNSEYPKPREKLDRKQKPQNMPHNQNSPRYKKQNERQTFNNPIARRSLVKSELGQQILQDQNTNIINQKDSLQKQKSLGKLQIPPHKNQLDIIEADYNSTKAQNGGIPTDSTRQNNQNPAAYQRDRHQINRIKLEKISDANELPQVSSNNSANNKSKSFKINHAHITPTRIPNKVLPTRLGHSKSILQQIGPLQSKATELREDHQNSHGQLDLISKYIRQGSNLAQKQSISNHAHANVNIQMIQGADTTNALQKPVSREMKSKSSLQKRPTHTVNYHKNAEQIMEQKFGRFDSKLILQRQSSQTSQQFYTKTGKYPSKSLLPTSSNQLAQPTSYNQVILNGHQQIYDNPNTNNYQLKRQQLNQRGLPNSQTTQNGLNMQQKSKQIYRNNGKINRTQKQSLLHADQQISAQNQKQDDKMLKNDAKYNNTMSSLTSSRKYKQVPPTNGGTNNQQSSQSQQSNESASKVKSTNQVINQQYPQSFKDTLSSITVSLEVNNKKEPNNNHKQSSHHYVDDKSSSWQKYKKRQLRDDQYKTKKHQSAHFQQGTTPNEYLKGQGGQYPLKVSNGKNQQKIHEEYLTQKSGALGPSTTHYNRSHEMRTEKEEDCSEFANRRNAKQDLATTSEALIQDAVLCQDILAEESLVLHQMSIDKEDQKRNNPQQHLSQKPQKEMIQQYQYSTVSDKNRANLTKTDFEMQEFKRQQKQKNLNKIYTNSKKQQFFTSRLVVGGNSGINSGGDTNKKQTSSFSNYGIKTPQSNGLRTVPGHQSVRNTVLSQMLDENEHGIDNGQNQMSFSYNPRDLPNKVIQRANIVGQGEIIDNKRIGSLELSNQKDKLVSAVRRNNQRQMNYTHSQQSQIVIKKQILSNPIQLREESGAGIIQLQPNPTTRLRPLSTDKTQKRLVLFDGKQQNSMNSPSKKTPAFAKRPQQSKPRYEPILNQNQNKDQEECKETRDVGNQENIVTLQTKVKASYLERRGNNHRARSKERSAIQSIQGTKQQKASYSGGVFQKKGVPVFENGQNYVQSSYPSGMQSKLHSSRQNSTSTQRQSIRRKVDMFSKSASKTQLKIQEIPSVSNENGTIPISFRASKQNKQLKLNLQFFEKGYRIGEGHFGKVFAVRLKDFEEVMQLEKQQSIEEQKLMQNRNQEMFVKEESDGTPQNQNILDYQSSSNIQRQTIKPHYQTFENIDEQGVYALKMIHFRHLNQEKLLEHLNNEKRVLLHLQNTLSSSQNYFPKIYATFKSDLHANLLLEQIKGTNLHHFQRKHAYISPNLAQYIAAQTLLILETLHQNSILYRDLKTENILIEEGSCSIKLVDFGFSKIMSKFGQSAAERTFTKCGTPGYTAPEVLSQTEQPKQVKSKLLNKGNQAVGSIALGGNLAKIQDSNSGYSYACDVWSWGVLLCELIGGFNPFEGQNVQETFNNIMQVNVMWPRNLTPQGIQLLQQIFKKNPQERISLAEIKRSQFFKNIEWANFQEQFLDEISALKVQIDKIQSDKGDQQKTQWTELKEVEEQNGQRQTQQMSGGDNVKQKYLFNNPPLNQRQKQMQLTEQQLGSIRKALEDF